MVENNCLATFAQQYIHRKKNNWKINNLSRGFVVLLDLSCEAVWRHRKIIKLMHRTRILCRGYCSLSHGWIIRSIDPRSQKRPWLLETRERGLIGNHWNDCESFFSSTPPHHYFFIFLLPLLFPSSMLVTNHAFIGVCARFKPITLCT